jgi:hypothetical protein
MPSVPRHGLVGRVPVADRGMGATRRASPYQHPRARPVEGARHRMLHRVAFRRVRIEDMRAVREVIADYQVEMTVAIHIRLGRRVAEPPLLAGDNLLREEACWTQAAGPVRPAEEDHRRTTPEIHQQLGLWSLGEVARQATHRRHRRSGSLRNQERMAHSGRRCPGLAPRSRGWCGCPRNRRRSRPRSLRCRPTPPQRPRKRSRRRYAPSSD